jgi:hypothetical protein
MASEREGLIESHDTTPHDDDTPKHFPRHVGFILGNEFCERFSFYGMRTILAMFNRPRPPLPPPFSYLLLLHISLLLHFCRFTRCLGMSVLLATPKTRPRA